MDREELLQSLKKLAWIAGLFIAAMIIISAVEHKQGSRAEGVEIEIEPLQDGAMLVKAEDILRSIDRSFGFRLEGLPLKELDPERLEVVLEKDPLILNADVFVDARNVVRIEVEQRQPVLRIIDRNGLNYYLDERGFKMPLSPHFAARVLVASGSIPPHVPDFLERKRHRLRVENPLAQEILSGRFGNGDVVRVEAEGGKLVFGS